MHKLFEQVFEKRDLSKAGDLFSLEDSVIVDELSDVIKTIQDISSKPEFLTSHNDQSLVEICVTRVISAVRETGSIKHHASSLISLLESCLAHSLRPSGRGDPPHAKMASDIMSCVFLNYDKKPVMQLAIPVAVKFLHKGNKDLSRNMSSYMSLAAIENADLLATHLQPILDSVISGNYSLSRVLPAIFAVDRELIKNHVMTLVSILPNCADSENLALLTLFGLIAKDTPALLEPSIPQLCECLSQQSTAPPTLQVLQDIALAKPKCLVDHISSFKLTAANFPKTTVSVIQLMSIIARTSADKARGEGTLEYILDVIGSVESEKHNLVLKEVITLTQKYPNLLNANLINRISGLEDAATSPTKNAIQEIKNDYNMQKIDKPHDKSERSKIIESFKSKEKEKAGITIVKVGGSKSDVNSGKEIQRGAEVEQLKSSTHTLPSSGARVELTSVIKHGRESATFSKEPERQNIAVERQTVAAERQSAADKHEERQAAYERLIHERQQQLLERQQVERNLAGITERQLTVSKKDGSRSTGKLPTHRSMTRLNMHTSASRLESRLGLHKSMTRLDHRYNSNQTVTTPPAQPVTTSATTSGTVGRSITCISTNTHRPPSISTYTARPGGVTVTTPTTHPSTGFNIPNSASPTKSMSSGSMSGLTERERDLAGREILTVNKLFINQIHTEFARQSHQLSSVFSRPLPTDYSRGDSLPPVSMTLSHSTSTAPLSLPSHTTRRLPPYSSGPLTSQQPPSLPGPLPPPAQPTITNSNSQPLDIPASQDRIPTSRSFDHPRSTFSNTLPSLRRRSHHVTSVSTSDGGDISEGSSSKANKNRMSVFEPFPMRDTVQHFCEKHLDKIKHYMESVSVKLPLPVKCTIEERKGKKHAKLHFACQGRGDHCLYKTTFYTMKSRHPRTWIHLMFMALQSRSQSALSTRDTGVSSLKNCWEILKCEEKSFSTLVTGAFPNARDQDSVIHELSSHRFFDVFEYNAPKLQWGCFLCNHPERASTFIAQEEPVIEGQLKEKKGGKWKIFKKWKSRYFTLSGARLAYKEGNNEGRICQALDVGSIRSVKVSKGGRNIPKAFEIFTADKTFILKAKDSSNAQEWVQCLTVAVAHSQAKDSTLRRLHYGGSLGRLNQGHARTAHYHSSLNSSLALRTAV